MVFFFLFYQRNKTEGFWVIFLYCILSAVADTAHHHIPKVYSFYIFSSFTIIEYTLFALFLYLSFKGKIFKYILLFCSVLFYVIAAFNLIAKRSETFDSLPVSLEASLLILYSIFFLYEQITDPAIFYVYYSKKFWIVIALLIYFSSTLFLFIYAASFTRQEHKTYWTINSLFDIIKNLLFAVSFAMKKNKQLKHPLEDLYPDTY
ncbi:MAG TPA: hypothetical protein VGM30_22010 [Puia sp.]